MQDVVRKVFSRLHTLDPVTEEKKLLAASEDPQETDVKMTVSVGPGVGLGISEGTITTTESETVAEEPAAVPVIIPATEPSAQRSDCKPALSS